MKTRFYKYHGAGNDFVLIDSIKEKVDYLTREAIIAICNRRFGIGADGILLIEEGKDSPFFMRIFNADGSQAEMCGNGIRCVAKHIVDVVGVNEEKLRIETLSGVKECIVRKLDNGETYVSVRMGKPILEPTLIPIASENINMRMTILGRTFEGVAISMGNPHFVVYQSVTPEEAEVFGKAISNAPIFPNQTNVEFVTKIGENDFKALVYERGCGLTMACGTGASAIAVANVLRGMARLDTPILITLPGGTLTITVLNDLSDVVLGGPAVLVFEGYLYEIPRLPSSDQLK